MKYQVIARKFRPQVFEEVVGQKPIVQTLQNAIQLNRVGHAYMFSGPRGVGKTTTARLLAKGLNCIQGPTITPCNQCASCKEITAGQSMDVLEIDAASNTGVDNIRELRESARYSPSRDRHKIFIIDEVHMLSTSAFNALLKILEEPPTHIVFIMATTERHKLPATILSRCQQFVFRTISAAEIHSHLRQIAHRENVKIDDRALSYVVRASEGSMRDAQSLLDQIISFSGQDVVDEDVRDVLGFIPSEILDDALAGLANRDSKALLNGIGIVVDQGLNIQQYVREFIGRVRDLLLMKLDLEDKVLGSADEKQALKTHAAGFSEQDLIRYFDMLLRLENDLRYTAQPRFHLEVGFVKLAKIGHLRDIEDVLRDLRQEGGGGASVTAAPTARPAPALPPPTPRTPRTLSTPPIAPRPEAVKPKAPEPAGPLQTGGFRDRFIDRVAERSGTTGIYLEKAERIEQTEDGLDIVMANATDYAKLDSKDHRAALAAAAADILGKAISVSLIIKGQPRPLAKQVELAKPIEVDADASKAAVPKIEAPKKVAPAAKPLVPQNDAARAEELRMDAVKADRATIDTAKAMESAKGEPMVQRFLEVFRGDLARVKPVKEEQS